MALCQQEVQAGLQRAGSMGWSCRANAISQLYAQRNVQEGKEASNVISMGCWVSMLLPKDTFCEFPSSTHLNPAPSPS